VNTADQRRDSPFQVLQKRPGIDPAARAKALSEAFVQRLALVLQHCDKGRRKIRHQ
jgi:hypothetical protein